MSTNRIIDQLAGEASEPQRGPPTLFWHADRGTWGADIITGLTQAVAQVVDADELVDEKLRVKFRELHGHLHNVRSVLDEGDDEEGMDQLHQCIREALDIVNIFTAAGLTFLPVGSGPLHERRLELTEVEIDPRSHQSVVRVDAHVPYHIRVHDRHGRMIVDQLTEDCIIGLDAAHEKLFTLQTGEPAVRAAILSAALQHLPDDYLEKVVAVAIEQLPIVRRAGFISRIAQATFQNRREELDGPA